MGNRSEAPDDLHTEAPSIDIASELDWSAVRSYLTDVVAGVDGNLQVALFSGGHSNLTYLLTIGERRLVVKRPPPGPRVKGAHDVGREYEILRRLRRHYPYAPAVLAFCAESAIAGAEFLVMEFVDGVVIRAQEIDRLSVTTSQRLAQLDGLVSALALLHAIDVHEALEGYGRPQGYRERQLSGWLDRMTRVATPDLKPPSGVTDWLRANLPRTPERASIIHNDFKLDNLVWRKDAITSLQAVLDWEMATAGDPLMDLACTLSFWVEATDPPDFRALRAMPNDFASAPTRRDALARYSDLSGIDLEDFQYYYAFAMFRRAAIEQQKYFRFVSGQSDDQRFAALAGPVATLLRMTSAVIDGYGL